MVTLKKRAREREREAEGGRRESQRIDPSLSKIEGALRVRAEALQTPPPTWTTKLCKCRENYYKPSYETADCYNLNAHLIKRQKD